MERKEWIKRIPIMKPVLIWIGTYLAHSGILLNPWREASFFDNLSNQMTWSLTRNGIIRKTPLQIKSLKQNPQICSKKFPIF